MHLKRLLGGVRRALLPQGVDQPVPGHDLIGVEEQHGEERPLLRAAEIERLPAGDHLQRAEDPKFHLPRLPVGGTGDPPTLAGSAHADSAE